jgi:hypothetical protein
LDGAAATEWKTGVRMMVFLQKKQDEGKRPALIELLANRSWKLFINARG